MSLNMGLPLVERLCSRGLCQYELEEEFGAKDADGKSKTEKEEEGKEKEAFSALIHAALTACALGTQERKRSAFHTDDRPVSQLFAALPELPPEA